MLLNIVASMSALSHSESVEIYFCHVKTLLNLFIVNIMTLQIIEVFENDLSRSTGRVDWLNIWYLILFHLFQWSLVCDREWTVATITTLQMIGVLAGCFIAGQLADWIGRKWVYCLAVASYPLLNILAHFSVSWEMYAVLRLLLGVMLGFGLTSKLNLVCEFLMTSWRPVFIAFPIWCIAAGAFALLTWLCQNWKTVHLATVVVGAPALLSCW